MGNLKIYQSSAGSGKTYTLVKEYLLLIFSRPAFLKNTLAITFTNDATGEMKERIVFALWQLSENRNPRLEKDVIETLQLSGSVQEMAKEALRFILHHYPDFSISTIDSFFLNITKAIARELGLPGKYDVDLNRDAAVDFMVNRVLLSIGENKELTYWLEDFAYDRMEDEKGWNMQAELKKIAGELFRDKYRELKEKYDQPIDKNAIRELRTRVNVFEDALRQKALAFFDIAFSAGVDASDFYYGNSGFASTVRKFTRVEFPVGYEFGKRYNEAAEGGNLFAKKAPDYILNDNALANDLRAILVEIKKYFEENISFYLSATATLKVIYLAGILNYLDEELKHYRHENNVMLISDTNRLLADFITGNDTPFIYEKAGNTYRNFLVDEFQDTSQQQWKNMLPLLQNSLSDGNHVLAVGDVKQSIYRWRGGDMKLLLGEVESQLGQIAQKTKVLQLENNFRSAVSVVNFNNALFSLIPEIIPPVEYHEDMIGLAYDKQKVVQRVIRHKQEGYVCIEKISKDDAVPDLLFSESISDGKKIFQSKAWDIIQSQLQKGYDLSDMVLLVRNNQEGNELADFLVLNGIEDIISRDSLLLQSAPQIGFMISAFRWLHDANNQIALAHLNWFAETSLGDKEGVMVSQLVGQRNYLIVLPLQELTGKLISLFNLNAKPDAFIQRLEDLVIEKNADGINDVASFLQWWDAEINRLKISVQVPPGKSAITITTIHRSKGLQYPVVIMPFTGWALGSGSKGNIWVKPDQEPFNRLGVFPVNNSSSLEKTIYRLEYLKEDRDKMLEEINALYVALTRAEEKLFVLLEEKKENKLNKAGDIISAALDKDDFVSAFTVNGKIYTMGSDGIRNRETGHKHEDSPVASHPATLLNYIVNDSLLQLGFKIKKYADEKERGLMEFGITAHHLLAGYLSVSDKPLVMEQISVLPLNEHDKKKLETEIVFAMDTLEKQNWTSSHFNIKPETDMADGMGNILRPDRLMLDQHKAVVLDYKTGVKSNDHLQQVISYKDVLVRAGFNEVRTYLLYLDLKELVEVK